MEYFKCVNCGETMGVNIIAVHGTISKDQLENVKTFEDFNVIYRSLKNLATSLEPMHLNTEAECTTPQLSEEDLVFCENILNNMTQNEIEE